MNKVLRVVIIAILATKTSASFFDTMRGAFQPLETSVSKLFSDVVTDLRQTIDCTILAVEHVFSWQAMFGRSVEYYDERCSGRKDNPLPSPLNDTYVEAAKDILMEEYNVKELDETINKTVTNTQDRQIIEDAFKNETLRLQQIHKIICEELDKLTTDVENRMKKLDHEVASAETVLSEVRRLYQIEQHDKSSSRANEVRQTFDKVLTLLQVNDTGGVYSDDEEVKVIMKGIGKSLGTAMDDVEIRFMEWKQDGKDKTKNNNSIKDQIDISKQNKDGSKLKRESNVFEAQSPTNSSNVNNENMSNSQTKPDPSITNDDQSGVDIKFTEKIADLFVNQGQTRNTDQIIKHITDQTVAAVLPEYISQSGDNEPSSLKTKQPLIVTEALPSLINSKSHNNEGSDQLTLRIIIQKDIDEYDDTEESTQSTNTPKSKSAPEGFHIIKVPLDVFNTTKEATTLTAAEDSHNSRQSSTNNEYKQLTLEGIPFQKAAEILHSSQDSSGQVQDEPETEIRTVSGSQNLQFNKTEETEKTQQSMQPQSIAKKLSQDDVEVSTSSREPTQEKSSTFISQPMQESSQILINSGAQAIEEISQAPTAPKAQPTQKNSQVLTSPSVQPTQEIGQTITTPIARPTEEISHIPTTLNAQPKQEISQTITTPIAQPTGEISQAPTAPIAQPTQKNSQVSTTPNLQPTEVISQVPTALNVQLTQEISQVVTAPIAQPTQEISQAPSAPIAQLTQEISQVPTTHIAQPTEVIIQVPVTPNAQPTEIISQAPTIPIVQPTQEGSQASTVSNSQATQEINQVRTTSTAQLTREIGEIPSTSNAQPLKESNQNQNNSSTQPIQEHSQITNNTQSTQESSPESNSSGQKLTHEVASTSNEKPSQGTSHDQNTSTTQPIQKSSQTTSNAQPNQERSPIWDTFNAHPTPESTQVAGTSNEQLPQDSSQNQNTFSPQTIQESTLDSSSSSSKVTEVASNSNEQPSQRTSQDQSTSTPQPIQESSESISNVPPTQEDSPVSNTSSALPTQEVPSTSNEQPSQDSSQDQNSSSTQPIQKSSQTTSNAQPMQEGSLVSNSASVQPTLESSQVPSTSGVQPAQESGDGSLTSPLAQSTQEKFQLSTGSDVTRRTLENSQVSITSANLQTSEENTPSPTALDIQQSKLRNSQFPSSSEMDRSTLENNTQFESESLQESRTVTEISPSSLNEYPILEDDFNTPSDSNTQSSERYIASTEFNTARASDNIEESFTTTSQTSVESQYVPSPKFRPNLDLNEKSVESNQKTLLDDSVSSYTSENGYAPSPKFNAVRVKNAPIQLVSEPYFTPSEISDDPPEKSDDNFESDPSAFFDLRSFIEQSDQADSFLSSFGYQDFSRSENVFTTQGSDSADLPNKDILEAQAIISDGQYSESLMENLFGKMDHEHNIFEEPDILFN